MTIDVVTALLALLFGTVSLWLSFRWTTHLSRLVQPTRPAHFVYLRMTAVWSVGGFAALVGIILIVQGVGLLSHFPQ